MLSNGEAASMQGRGPRLPALARTPSCFANHHRDRVVEKMTPAVGTSRPIEDVRASVVIGGKPEDICSF